MLEGVWRNFTYNYCAPIFFKLYVYYTTYHCFPITTTSNNNNKNNIIDRRHQFSISSYGWVCDQSLVEKTESNREFKTSDRSHTEKDEQIRIM